MGDFGLQVDTYVRALSPVEFDKLADLHNQSLFSDSLPVSGKMQDDTILEKSSAKQIALSPSTVQSNGTTDPADDEVSKTVKNGVTANGQEEKKCDILNPSSLHLALSTDHTVPSVNVTPVTSLSSAAGLDLHQWSQAPADDTYFQGFQSLNGTVSFQQFPSAQNSVLSQTHHVAGFPGSHVGITGAHHQQQPAARRAITAHHNFPARQSNFMLNNPKTYQNWSTNAHQAPVTWPPGQQGHSSLCPAPWGNVMPPQHQRRSVPNVNALAPLSFKKPTIQHQLQHQHQAMLAPSKFRRSASFSGQIHPAAAGMKHLDYNTYDDLGHREGLVTYQASIVFLALWNFFS